MTDCRAGAPSRRGDDIGSSTYRRCSLSSSVAPVRTVQFTYDDRIFDRDVGIDPTCQPVACSIRTRVVRTRSIAAGGHAGVWNYVYEPYVDPEFRDRTLVTAYVLIVPSGM